MTIDDKNILWLDLFETLTYNKKIKLLSCIKKGQSLRKEFLKNPIIKEILTNEEFSRMALTLEERYLERYLEEYEKNNIKVITFNSFSYPYMLKEISSPPLCLYCKGNIQLLNSFAIGIVGTRKPTEYGVVVTKQYCKELCKADVTIVSGMAVGIDTVAHKTAIEEQGKTIAVLAGGFNHIYPTINLALSKKIAENNLLISEFAPNVKAQTYYFPIRNRIIAGLSKGVLVPEMGEKSGAMHTINYALEFNRDIFVVPGKINSPMSKGTNELIKNLQGCVTTSPGDIISNYNLKPNKETSNLQLDLNSQIILNYTNGYKRSFQEILEHTKLSASELNSALLMLEMDGLIIKLPNNNFIAS